MIVMYNRDCRYDRDYSPSKDYYHSNYGRNGVTKANVVTTVVTTRVVLQCGCRGELSALLCIADRSDASACGRGNVWERRLLGRGLAHGHA